MGRKFRTRPRSELPPNDVEKNLNAARGGHSLYLTPEGILQVKLPDKHGPAAWVDVPFVTNDLREALFDAYRDHRHTT